MVSSQFSRIILFTLTRLRRGSLLAAVTLTLFTLAGCTSNTEKVSTVPTSNLAKGAQIAQIPPEALKNALNIFSKARESDQNLSNGPCLGKIADDWVLDIAHNPRQAVDDKPENQCADYKNGKVQHFIEMDASGQIIEAH